MHKILRAHGPNGRSDDGKQWNWCEGEAVGYHGMICDNACTCGCNRAFRGIESSTSTTMAIVEEVSDAEFSRLRDVLLQTTLRGWGNDLDIAGGAVGEFDTLSRLVQNAAIGAVMRCKLTDTSVELFEVPQPS